MRRPAFKFKTDPHPPFKHQQALVEEHLHDVGYALWWEQGTGKSRGIIDTAAAMYCEDMIDGLLVIAPNNLHRNFISRELPKHLSDDVAAVTESFFWSTSKSKTKAWQNLASEFLAKRDRFQVLGMSYDGFMTEAGRALVWEFLQGGRRLYALDEAARIKEPKSNRTVRILKSAPYSPMRRILTGTPVTKAPWDTYPQIKFLDDAFWRGHGLDSPEAMKAAFGVWDSAVRRVPAAAAGRAKSLAAFYARTGVPECLRTSYEMIGPGEALMRVPALARSDDGKPQYKNLDRLREILKPIRSRVLKSDVFDLPPKLYTTLDYDLTPTQRKVYNEICDRGFTIVGDHTCSPELAMTVLLRLQQIVCGYLIADLKPGQEDPDVLPIDPNPRIELLRDVVQDISHQGIIWARFTPDIDLICSTLKKLGLTYARYDGKIDDDECFENEERFHRGEAQWFVSNQQKGGEGLTLTEARTMIYYSNSFRLGDRLQSEDRAHRWGQNFPLDIIDIISRDTMEEGLINNLIGKFDVASIVTGDGLRPWIKQIGRLL